MPLSMGDIVKKKISSEIQEVGYYSIMADKSKDVSKKRTAFDSTSVCSRGECI